MSRNLAHDFKIIADDLLIAEELHWYAEHVGMEARQHTMLTRGLESMTKTKLGNHTLKLMDGSEHKTKAIVGVTFTLEVWEKFVQTASETLKLLAFYRS